MDGKKKGKQIEIKGKAISREKRTKKVIEKRLEPINVYELKTNIIKKIFIEKSDEWVVRKFSDAKTQTNVVRGKVQEEEEEEEEETRKNDDIEVKLNRCPVCLTLFNSKNRLMLPNCGHGLCQICVNVLFSGPVNADVKCALCRAPRLKNDYVLMKFYHFETICPSERLIILNSLESLKNKTIHTVLSCIDGLLELEKKKQKNLPSVCHKLSLGKRRLEFLEFLDTEYKVKSLTKIKSQITESITEIEQTCNVISVPSENILFDIAELFVKQLVKRVSLKQSV